jgi:hypothetical protein
LILPAVRHASYGNSFTSSAFNVISVSAQSVTRNSPDSILHWKYDQYHQQAELRH